MITTAFVNGISKCLTKIKDFFKNIFASPDKTIAFIVVFFLSVMVVILVSLASAGVFGDKNKPLKSAEVAVAEEVEESVIVETPLVETTVAKTQINETFVPLIEINPELEQEIQVARQEGFEAIKVAPVIEAIPFIEINKDIDSEIEVESIQTVDIIDRIEFIPVNTKQ